MSGADPLERTSKNAGWLYCLVVLLLFGTLFYIIVEVTHRVLIWKKHNQATDYLSSVAITIRNESLIGQHVPIRYVRSAHGYSLIESNDWKIRIPFMYSLISNNSGTVRTLTPFGEMKLTVKRREAADGTNFVVFLAIPSLRAKMDTALPWFDLSEADRKRLGEGAH